MNLIEKPSQEFERWFGFVPEYEFAEPFPPQDEFGTLRVDADDFDVAAASKPGQQHSQAVRFA